MVEFVFTEEMNKYTEHMLFWGRFIDDVLLFWDGDEHLFKEFVHKLNHNQIGMQFTSEIWMAASRPVYIINHHKTSTNGFLQWQSHHPSPLKRGIPVGQYLRARRNCSDEATFEMECKELNQRFVDRGYPKRHLRRAYWRAKNTKREELLKEGTKQAEKKCCTDNYKMHRHF